MFLRGKQGCDFNSQSLHKLVEVTTLLREEKRDRDANTESQFKSMSQQRIFEARL